MSRSVSRATLIALACIFVGAVGAIGVHPADAQEPGAPSLLGENLFAGPDSPVPQGVFEVELNCRPGVNQGGTITFSASGVANGPYPGTFTENGTVEVQPAVPGVSSGPLASLHAEFTIVSGRTVIRGFKELRDVPLTVFRNEGSCEQLDSQHNAGFVSEVSYQATIETPTGSFRDRGQGRVDAQDVHSENFRFNSFVESFTMSESVVRLCEEADEDDDGLRDDRELAFGTSLGNADSDDDGVADGDDDSDGDDEDDEDEDDEVDPCPSDSDRDGGEDEDEND